MLRVLCFALIVTSAAGCAHGNANAPAVATQVGQVATAALAAYQAALGAAEQAQLGNPAVAADIKSIGAAAAPYVADAQTVAAQAATAPTLATLSAELLLNAAPYITVTPNGK